MWQWKTTSCQQRDQGLTIWFQKFWFLHSQRKRKEGGGGGGYWTCRQAPLVWETSTVPHFHPVFRIFTLDVPQNHFHGCMSALLTNLYVVYFCSLNFLFLMCGVHDRSTGWVWMCCDWMMVLMCVSGFFIAAARLSSLFLCKRSSTTFPAKFMEVLYVIMFRMALHNQSTCILLSIMWRKTFTENEKLQDDTK